MSLEYAHSLERGQQHPYRLGVYKPIPYDTIAEMAWWSYETKEGAFYAVQP